MATQSYATTSGLGNWPRRLELGSEDFSVSGRPVFREWLRNGLPPAEEQKGRRFVTRNGSVYENFASVNGRFIGLEVISKEMKGKLKKVLIVFLHDGREQFNVNLGQYDGRYAINFLLRLCSDEILRSAPISLEPYRWAPDPTKLNRNGEPKEVFGITIRQVDKKIEPRKRDGAFLVPEAEKDNRGNIYFDVVADYLLDWIERNVMPVIQKLQLPQVQYSATHDNQHETAGAQGIQTNIQPTAEANRFPTPAGGYDPGFPDTPPPEGDDLPF